MNVATWVCFRGALIWTQRGFHFHSCWSPLLLFTVTIHWLHYAPPTTTRVAAVAPPKSHNLIHHRHQRNPTTRYIIEVCKSLTHSLDRLTGDGSLRPPDFSVTMVTSTMCPVSLDNCDMRCRSSKSGILETSVLCLGPRRMQSADDTSCDRLHRSMSGFVSIYRKTSNRSRVSNISQVFNWSRVPPYDAVIE